MKLFFSANQIDFHFACGEELLKREKIYKIDPSSERLFWHLFITCDILPTKIEFNIYFEINTPLYNRQPLIKKTF